MTLNTIVSVNITRATSTPTRVGFGTPLITAYHTVFPERYRLYSSTAAMLTDGFTASDPAYVAANTAFSQEVSPPQIAIGRTENDQVMTNEITPSSTDLRASTEYIVYHNGVPASYTTDATPTVAEITAGLTAAIDPSAWVNTTAYTVGEHVTNDTAPVKIYKCTTAGTSAGAGGPTGTSTAITDGTVIWSYVGPKSAVTATDGTTKITIAADAVASPFSLYVNEPLIMDIADVTADGAPSGITEDLAAIRAQYDDWYMLVPTNQGKAVLEAAAIAIEGYTALKYMLSSSPDSAIYDSTSTTDIAATLQTANYDRSAILYHHKSSVQFPAAGWAGRCLPEDSGEITWAYWTLNGVDASTLSDTQISAITGKNANYYLTLAGISNTFYGTSASGEHIDIMRGTDNLQARIQEYVYAGIVNADKVPYTDPGAGILEARLRQALDEFTIDAANPNRLLTNNPAPEITVPKVSAQSATDKGNRYFPGITFNGIYSGAIHKVGIAGTISL